MHILILKWNTEIRSLEYLDCIGHWWQIYLDCVIGPIILALPTWDEYNQSDEKDSHFKYLGAILRRYIYITFI